MQNQDTLKRQLLESYLRSQSGNMHGYGSTASSHVSVPQTAVSVPHTAVSVPQTAASATRSVTQTAVSVPQNTGNQLVPLPVTVNENITLEEFREYVKKWLELDNMIKKAQEAIKERKKIRDKLSQIITAFMCKYNIEDINTKEGRIKCKVTAGKTPINQKVIKQKITDYFSDDQEKQMEIISKIFEDREKVEKVSLRRLKIT
jgi:hypothetical protein